MNVITWDPFKDFNPIFNRALRHVGAKNAEDSQESWAPLVDIYESETDFLLHAELPGVDKKAVEVSVDKNVLTIKGEKLFSKAKEGESYHRVETQSGEFTRRFNLPEDVNVDKISADYKDGILSLSLPKATPEKPKLINVKVH